MKKLTAEKCAWIISQLKRADHLPQEDDYHLQALEIALPILEQQERGDGWIEWGGGDSPFKDDELKIIEVKFSSGDIVKDYAGIWWWGRCGDEDDIIAYRVIEQQERERGEE